MLFEIMGLMSEKNLYSISLINIDVLVFGLGQHYLLLHYLVWANIIYCSTTLSKSLSTSCALGLVHVCTMQQNMNITPPLSHAYSLHISHVSNRTIYYYTIVPPSCYMLQIDYHITSLSKCLMFHSVVYLYIWNTCMVLSQIVP